MWAILGFLFLISGVIYIYREIRVIKRENDLIIISFVRLLYACSCGFFAAILCFLYSFNGIKLHLSTLVVVDYGKSSLMNLFVFWICSVVGYISLSLGYRLVGNKKLVIGKKRLLRGEMNDHLIMLTALICTLVGYLAIIIWTSDMGGISNYIKLASAIRGDYANVLGNYHMGWRKIARLLPPATYMTFFLILKSRGKVLRYWFVFIISTIGSIIYLICNDGRLTTAMFLLVLAVGYFRYGDRRDENIKKQFTVFAVVLLFAFILLANLDNISYFIRNGAIASKKVNDSENGIFMSLMSEFTYIYKAGMTAVENCFPKGKLMLFDDIAFGIKAYVPGPAFLGDCMQVSLYNTILCTGNPNSLAGSIPCDMIALSIYDLSFLGPIVIPFFIGVTIRFIENHFNKKKDNPLSQTFYYGMALVFIRVVTYLDTYDFLTSIFPYVLLYVITMFVKFIGNIAGERR